MVGGCGGSAVVNGVKVCVDLAGVGVGVGASVGCDTPDGGLKLVKRASENREGGPTMSVNVELPVECSGFFRVPGTARYRRRRKVSKMASILYGRFCQAWVRLPCG